MHRDPSETQQFKVSWAKSSSTGLGDPPGMVLVFHPSVFIRYYHNISASEMVCLLKKIHYEEWTGLPKTHRRTAYSSTRCLWAGRHWPLLAWSAKQTRAGAPRRFDLARILDLDGVRLISTTVASRTGFSTKLDDQLCESTVLSLLVNHQTLGANCLTCDRKSDIEGSKATSLHDRLAATTSSLSLWTPALSFNRCAAPAQTPPPAQVFRPDRTSRSKALDNKRGQCPAFRFQEYRLRVQLKQGLLCPADSAMPVPLAVVSLDSRQGLSHWDRYPLALASAGTIAMLWEGPKRAVPTSCLIVHRPEAVSHLGVLMRLWSLPIRAWEALGPPDFSEGAAWGARTRASCGCSSSRWNPTPTESFPGVGRLCKQYSTQFGTVNRLPVHPASQFCLPNNWLTMGALDSVGTLLQAAAPYLTYLKCENSFERFARQYRCGLSPDFHIWLRPALGIIVHPSFGSRQACSTLRPFSEDHGRSAVHPARGGSASSAFLAPCGFTHPLTRNMSDSLVRVSRRRAEWGARRTVPGSAPGPKAAPVTACRISCQTSIDGEGFTGISTARDFGPPQPYLARVHTPSDGGPAYAVPHRPGRIAAPT
ncbi:hypothetical protein Tco_0694523 [Tanacetum coccineum]